MTKTSKPALPRLSYRINPDRTTWSVGATLERGAWYRGCERPSTALLHRACAALLERPDMAPLGCMPYLEAGGGGLVIEVECDEEKAIALRALSAVLHDLGALPADVAAYYARK